MEVDEDDPPGKLTVHRHMSVTILSVICNTCAISKTRSSFKIQHIFSKTLHFKVALLLRHRTCAADTRQNGDGYVVVDGELSSQIVFVVFNPTNPGRSFLESSILPLYVYLLPLYIYLVG
jgi:hypothetical protein